MKATIRAGVLVAVLAGCAEEPLGYEYIDQFSLSVLQGGSGGVYFLPPLLQSEFEGTFAPDRNPVVMICGGAPESPCADPVDDFDMVRDEGESESRVVRVSEADEHYIVNWNTSGVAQGQYRIFVTEDGAALAFIDVALGSGSASARRVRTYGSEATRLVEGTIPVVFRMEERAAAEATGLLAQYYDWSGSVPDFNQAALLLERVDPVVDFVGDTDVFGVGQSDSIMARWSGFMIADATATYTICVDANDGVRLFISGYVFVSSWTDKQRMQHCRSYAMSQGTRYPIAIEWYHRNGTAAARLLWETPTMSRRIIPSSALQPD